MEATIYKPSIYKGAGIYKAGAEGGGGGGGILPPPENFAFIEYYNQTTSANGYFPVQDYDIKIAPTDNIYFKFETNVYKSWFPFRLLQADDGNGKNVEFLFDDGPYYGSGTGEIETYNLTSSKKATTYFYNTDSSQLHYVKRTKSGFVCSWGLNISQNTQSNNDFKLQRFYINNTSNVKVYRTIVTDESENIKLNIYPVINKNTNEIALWLPETEQIISPTSQTGLVAGPEIIY